MAPADNLAPPWSPGATTCAREKRGPMHPMRITSRRTAANRTCKPGLPLRQKFKSSKSFIFLPRPLGDDLGKTIVTEPYFAVFSVDAPCCRVDLSVVASEYSNSGFAIRLRIYLVILSETSWYCCALVLAPVPVTCMT
jgi:hypothetical protein